MQLTQGSELSYDLMKYGQLVKTETITYKFSKIS